MQRNAMKDLINWKNKKNRTPLLLYGARQVGKTYLVKEFGEKFFKDIIYINFETNNIVSKIIDDNISPKYIIKNRVRFRAEPLVCRKGRIIAQTYPSVILRATPMPCARISESKVR